MLTIIQAIVILFARAYNDFINSLYDDGSPFTFIMKVKFPKYLVAYQVFRRLLREKLKQL